MKKPTPIRVGVGQNNNLIKIQSHGKRKSGHRRSAISRL